MKIIDVAHSFIRAGVIALVVTTLSLPETGFAQARLIDFSGRVIDPYLWEGQSTGASLEVSQQIRRGRARLELRGLGDLDRSDGRRGAAQGLVVKSEVGSRIDFIEMRSRLTGVRLSGCPANASEPRAQIRIIGNFFADGVDPGSSEFDNTGKVLSIIALESQLGDFDRNQYRATYYAGLCADSNCDESEPIASGESGTFPMGTWVRLAIANDMDTRQLTFSVNGQSETFDYASIVPSPVPILEPRIRLHLDAKTPNCETSVNRRPFVRSAGEIDWVRINESAFN